MSVQLHAPKALPLITGSAEPVEPNTGWGSKLQSKRFAEEKNQYREPNPEFSVAEPVINFMYC